MNGLRTNWFLGGLLVALLVGSAGLGWLIWGASARLAEVNERYLAQENEFKRLTALVPFPDPANIAKLEEQKKLYAASAQALEGQFATFEPAVENLDPSGFQDKLRKEVDAVSAKARAANVRLPEGFYLGFERYRAELPTEKAVPLLARELLALRALMHVLIESGTESIGAIKRFPVPGETAVPGSPLTAAAPSDPAVAGPSKKLAAAPLVARYPFEIAFTAEHGAFRRALARVMEIRPLLVVRTLRVKNEKDKGPARGQEAPKTEVSGVAAKPAESETGLRYIVGREHLEATLRMEMIKFQPSDRSG